jgi:hypothetical protein
MPKMTPCNTRYGAPMGRHSYGLIQNCKPGSVRLFHVPLDSGGYDDGGAYWGHGERLYCARTDDGEFFQTVRASNRAHAALLLDIEPVQLVRGIGTPAWMRYSAQLAYIGRVSPVWQVCEFGQPVGYVEDWSALCWFAQTGEGLTPYKRA